MTSIAIPNSVKSIGTGAFSGCSSLPRIIIPKQVSSIGDFAFENCNSLKVVIDENPIPIPIKENTFSNRKNAELIIPVGSKKEYSTADYWRDFLNIIESDNSNIAFVDAKVKSICLDNWDMDNDGEISKAEVANVNSIEQIFAGSAIISFNELQFFKSLKEISEGAFRNCSKLEFVSIPSNVKTISKSAFAGCTRLHTVTINSDDVVSYNFSPLKELFGSQVANYIIGDGVKRIGNNLFKDCSSLTSVSIPSSLTGIGFEAFYGCTNMTKVNISDISAWCNIQFNDSYSNPLYYAHNLYLNDMIIADIIIPANITEIGNYAFIGCKSFTSVNIPNSVSKIGDKAFYDCTELLSVTINSNKIVSESYSTYLSLRNIFGSQVQSYVIGDEVTRIGSFAFYSCDNLISIVIPTSVTNIGEYAFYGCSGLSSITIHNNIITIGNNAFSNCCTNFRLSVKAKAVRLWRFVC